MPRTQHALIFAVVICAIAVLLAIFGDSLRLKKSATHNASDVVFVTESREYTVAEEPKPDKQKIRDAFLAKIKNRSEGASLINAAAMAPVTEAQEPAPSSIDGPVEKNESTNARIVSIPERGALYLCGGGTLTQNNSGTVRVDGAVMWSPHVSMTVAEGARIVRSNGVPTHAVGVFPAGSTDDAYGKRGAKNAIIENLFALQVPQIPSVHTSPLCVRAGAVGVALNGVPLYAGIEENTDALVGAAFDRCGGHTDASGTYHYHNESECLLGGYFEGAQSTLLGYALDGFGIFASVEHGAVVHNEDLDVCHGHTHEIPWDGAPVSLYHYHMNNEFPYTVGCFMGMPAFPAAGG